MKILLLFKTAVSIPPCYDLMALLKFSFQFQTAQKSNVVLHSLFKQFKTTDS